MPDTPTARFSQKLVLVAGGTGGLGRAVSLAFLADGAQVIVTYRNQDEFAALQKAAGVNAAALAGESVDVTSEESVAQMMAASSRHGPLDALVNTVGGYAGGPKFWQADTQTFDKMFLLNLRSGYVLTRAVLPAMLARKSGAIVNIASKAAVEHAAGVAAYAASKAAALAMIDSLAADLKGSGVRVNTVLPSMIDTDANRKAMPTADFAKWPKPEDIARVILFLCSDDAKVVHGAALPVYGDS